MNKALLLFLACIAATGCRNHYQSDVVKETYVHKYGVPISASDWEKEGQDGKMVQLQKDGVTVTRSFEKGIPHGVTSWSFPNTTTIYREEEHEHGQLTAKREHYLSGMPHREECYDDLGSLSKRMRWYEDGSPAGIETYERGLLITGEYRTPLNSVDSRIQDGTGVRTMRNNDGELIAKDTFFDGEMTERTTFYPNGDPESISPYANGVVNGNRLVYFRGGLPKAIEQWSSGEQHGVTTVFHNGEKFSEVPYIHGQKHGIELRFRDGELLVEEISWLNDHQHGSHKIYVDGSTKVEWYHQGEIVSRPTFERLNPPRAER